MLYFTVYEGKPSNSADEYKDEEPDERYELVPEQLGEVDEDETEGGDEGIYFHLFKPHSIS